MPESFGRDELREIAGIVEDESFRGWDSESSLSEHRLVITYGTAKLNLDWDGREYRLVVPD